jgi:hypothetical protein
MNKLNRDKQVQIINALVEGNSLRATARVCDVAFNTVLNLLPEIGKACAEYQDRAFRNFPCKRLQLDEIWSFCYAKEKNVPDEMRGKFGFGDVWTFTAICADTKLVPSWLVGKRDAGHAFEFVNDLAGRLAHRAQVTTDGHRMYLEAVEGAFGSEVDYGMLSSSIMSLRRKAMRNVTVQGNVVEPGKPLLAATPTPNIFLQAM